MHKGLFDFKSPGHVFLLRYSRNWIFKSVFFFDIVRVWNDGLNSMPCPFLLLILVACLPLDLEAMIAPLYNLLAFDAETLFYLVVV